MIRFACVVQFLTSVAMIWPAVARSDGAPRTLERWLAPQAWQRDTDGPIISLGKPGQFDDTHIFAPAVARENGRFQLWYCGSQGTRSTRVFRLGLATGTDGKHFEKYAGNPVLEFADGEHSVLTPGLLHDGDGNVLREHGKLRTWFSSTDFDKTSLHTLHESTSADGIHWTDPSPPLLDHVYCPSVLKEDQGYRLWFVDVSKRPWVIRHAASADGVKWTVDERPVLQLSQPWEAEIVVYPCVLKVEGTYLMWYGSYYSAVRRQTTAIGFAASTDGLMWHKHPQNPVLRPDQKRPWESHYVTSGCVMRLGDGSFRYWYASRTKPPFVNLYFAINTARWDGPPAADKQAGGDGQPPNLLRLPPTKGDVGFLSPPGGTDGGHGRSVEVLEVIDEDDAILRAWYVPAATSAADNSAAGEATFVDLWVHGISTSGLVPGSKIVPSELFQVTGNKSFDTACGGRSVPALEPVPKD
jgi:predicted GH43/DUF377 family glycosyl hydrolase